MSVSSKSRIQSPSEQSSSAEDVGDEMNAVSPQNHAKGSSPNISSAEKSCENANRFSKDTTRSIGKVLGSTQGSKLKVHIILYLYFCLSSLFC